MSLTLRGIRCQVALLAPLRRAEGETVGIDESVSQLQGIIENMRRAIKEKEQEVAGLEKEKLDLERYKRGN
jgi:hypothetical protein